MHQNARPKLTSRDAVQSRNAVLKYIAAANPMASLITRYSIAFWVGLRISVLRWPRDTRIRSNAGDRLAEGRGRTPK